MRLFFVSLCILTCAASDLRFALNTPLKEHVDPNKEFLDSLDHPGNPYRSMRFAATPTEIQQCNAGICCDTRMNLFMSYGRICGEVKDECKVAICSGQSSECYPIDIADGTTCKGGKCFQGDCVRDCVGECCLGRFAKKDGTECSDGGICVNGVCAKKCYGDCCESFQSFAKPDGAPCYGGSCEGGKCISEDGTSNGVDVLVPEEMKDQLNGQKAIAVVVDEKKPVSALDTEWAKVLKDEEHYREEQKKKEAEKKAAAQEAELKEIETKKTQELATLKSAQTDANKGTSYWIFGIISGGVLVAILIIVLIIVAVVSHNRKKKQKAKLEKDSNESYQAF